MTTTAKTGIILVIILVIIVLGWAWYNNSQSKVDILPPVAVVTTPVPTPTPRIPNTVGTGLSAEGDTSTTALQNDIDALGKQMEFLTTDSANIDQGISSVAN